MSFSLRALIFVCLIQVPISAWSVQKNPQIRVCNQLSGQFFVADSDADQFGFCRFGAAAVGTLDLLQLKNENQLSEALQAYKDGQTHCESNGHISRLSIPMRHEILVCVFNDGSLILNSTLETGKNAEANRELNNALNL